jgi:hypothetical protein
LIYAGIRRCGVDLRISDCPLSLCPARGDQRYAAIDLHGAACSIFFHSAFATFFSRNESVDILIPAIFPDAFTDRSAHIVKTH